MVAIARAPIAGLPNIGMSQSTILVGSLIGGFFVWLAANQKLGVYWSILIGGGSATAPASTTPGATTTAPSPPGATATTAGAAPSNASLGLPTTQGSIFGLGGTTSTATTATGSVGTSTPTGIPGLPNISLDQFFGLQ